MQAMLVKLAAPWASLYGESSTLQIAVVFVHLAGLLIGGGAAFAADRATLRLGHATPADPLRHLAELSGTHRAVLLGLALTFASGFLLLAADLETYLASAVFWTKMGLVALLLANGFLLQRAGEALRGDAGHAWSRLRTTALTSATLWVAVVLLSAWLTNAA